MEYVENNLEKIKWIENNKTFCNLQINELRKLRQIYKQKKRQKTINEN